MGISATRRAPRGYTTIEVMIAMTVFAIGVSGIIGMERTVVQGNLEARRLDIANGIARAWLERIRRDGMAWTNPAASGSPNTSYIAAYLGAGWSLPKPAAGVVCPAGSTNGDGLCPAFDVLGRDLSQGDWSTATYCAHVKIDDLVPGQLVRAQVRVIWPRNLSTAPPANFCSVTNVSSADANNASQVYHFVYAATAVRVNPLP